MKPDNLEQAAIKKLNKRVDKLELENASLVQDVNLLNVLKPGVDILQGESGDFSEIPGAKGDWNVDTITLPGIPDNYIRYTNNVPHGLSYVPFIEGFWETTSGYFAGVFTVQAPSSGYDSVAPNSNSVLGFISADDTNVLLSFQDIRAVNSPNAVISFYWREVARP